MQGCDLLCDYVMIVSPRQVGVEDIQARWWSEIRDLLQILCRLDREELPTGLDPGSLLLFMIASLKWEVFGLVGRRGDIPPLGTPGGIFLSYISSRLSLSPEYSGVSTLTMNEIP